MACHVRFKPQVVYEDEPKDAKFWILRASTLRFNEWGRATWQLQLPYLQLSTGYDWHFAAYQSEADGDMEEQMNFIAARVLEDRATTVTGSQRARS